MLAESALKTLIDVFHNIYHFIIFDYFKYFLLFIILIGFCLKLIKKQYEIICLIDKIPGPPVNPWLPWLGHAYIVLDLDRFKYSHGTYSCKLIELNEITINQFALIYHYYLK